MPLGKAVGPDGIPVELLRAGGESVVTFLYNIIGCAVEKLSVPLDWKGGRLARLWKGKADASICSNSRGLLLGSHSGKKKTHQLYE